MHDQQPVTGWLNVVLHTLAPRSDHTRLALWVLGAQQSIFRGQLAGAAKNHPAIVPAGIYPHPEPLIRVVQHLNVLSRVRAQPVPKDGVWSPGFIDSGVEKVAALCPRGAVSDGADLIGQ